MFDSQQRVIICNERYGQMYGLSADQVKPGTHLGEIIEHRIARGIFAFNDPAQYRRERLAPVTTAADKVLELSDGRTIAVSQRPMSTGGWVTTHEDITERRRIEARIAHLAHYDALTDLPNRALLRERLEQALAGDRREDHSLSVMMLDLDRFKEVNDTLGHGAGDTLLKAVAERLLSCVRETDTVARLGGDEFAIVHSVQGRRHGRCGACKQNCRVSQRDLRSRRQSSIDQHERRHRARACGRHRSRSAHSQCRSGALPLEERRARRVYFLRGGDGSAHAGAPPAGG